jgi:hypothetical protein
MKTSPIRDNNGTVDSDLLLKWGGAIIALALLLVRGLAGLWGVPAEQLPGVDTISLAFLAQFGSAGAYITKHRMAGSNRYAQPPLPEVPRG